MREELHLRRPLKASQAVSAASTSGGPQLADSGPLHPGSDFQGLEEELPRVRTTGLISLGNLPSGNGEMQRGNLGVPQIFLRRQCSS